MKKPFLDNEDRLVMRTNTFVGKRMLVGMAKLKVQREIDKALNLTSFFTNILDYLNKKLNMKKLFLALLFLAASQAQAAITFAVYSISEDTATEGDSYTLKIIGAPSGPTDTGRVYLHHAESSQVIPLFKINLNDLNTLPKVGNAWVITVTLPAGIKYECDFMSNGDNSQFYGVFLRSATPDLSLVQIPGLNGPFSGLSGFNIHFKFKWTYESVITDTLRFYLDAAEVYKIALSDLENDSSVNFTIMGLPGTRDLTTNYISSSEFQYPITINSPTTGVIEPFSLETKNNIKYFNLLGQPVTPKDGDLIRITPYGAVVISQ